MGEDVKKRCFTLFGNLKFKKDINQGGMGLGLASSYLICKSLKGNLLLLRSELSIGSKFLFFLPVDIADEKIKPQPKIENVQSLNIRLGFP
jgi:signal transduction histidine kinase